MLTQCSSLRTLSSLNYCLSAVGTSSVEGHIGSWFRTRPNILNRLGKCLDFTYYSQVEKRVTGNACTFCKKNRNRTIRDTQLGSHCSDTCLSLFQCCFVMVFQSDDCPVSRPILKGKRTSSTTCQRSNVPSSSVTNCSLVCRRRSVLEQTEGPPQQSGWCQFYIPVFHY